MSLKIYITLFFTLLAALVALLLLEDPEQVKSVAFNPAFLIGFFGLVGYSMVECKNRYLTDLGVLFVLVALAIGAWFTVELISQFLNDYNIKIVTKWGE
ncbi:hypothetical protein [Priestia megaterium]|uniref:hypothetical protein n=1 Tax=Priestia megaterium TaxID=1404 RepID=UPI002E1F893B|nr:hypothetical protein [Priestia megaterium]MED4102158.1 hypothetical protein [Priestia megaterium]MED4142585.1 hypothetical protein [Priestia megaterium]